MTDLAGISEMELAAMIERGALTLSPEAASPPDWLSVPPAHVRDQQWDRVLRDSNSAPSAPSPQVHHTRLLSSEHLLAAPAARYVVRGVLPSSGLAALYGPPGSGKSFLAMDLVLAIATGQTSWFGRRLERAPVAYLALEGHGGMASRVRAWMAHTSASIPTNVRFFAGSLSLLNDVDARTIAKEIRVELGPGTVTVIDTLSRALPGGDENSSVDMTKAIGSAQLLGDAAAGPVILVHHTGKDASKGLRGHSSLLGAVDTAIEVVNLNGCRFWRVTKAKEDEAGAECPFDLVPYPVGADQWGDEIRSCAVRPSLSSRQAALPRLTGKNQIAVMDAIRPAIASASSGAISWSQATQLGATKLSVPSGRRNTVAKETIERLMFSGHLQLKEGQICIP